MIEPLPLVLGTWVEFTLLAVRIVIVCPYFHHQPTRLQVLALALPVQALAPSCWLRPVKLAFCVTVLSSRSTTWNDGWVAAG